MVPRSGGFLDLTSDPGELPEWLTEEDVAAYTEQFAKSGFRGGLNWYRNIDRNWELTSAFAGAQVTVPALFIVGERDLVTRFHRMPQVIANLRSYVPQLQETVMLRGCGHWTQQERPAEVNAALIGFCTSLRG